MIHDFSPFALRIYEDFGFRWYGLSYLAGFIAAYMMIRWLAARQRTGMTISQIGDFVTYTAVGTLIGGRLGYCLFYAPDLFAKFKDEAPFWGVLAVNEGGMASFGGMLGIALASWLFARKNNINTLYLLDLVSVASPIGIFFGRIANFINGEMLGKSCDPSFPLAVRFPQEILLWPKSDFGKLSELMPMAEKVGIAKDQWLMWIDQYRLDEKAREEIFTGLSKIIDQIQKGDLPLKEALGPLLTYRHPSQLYAAVAEGLFLFILLMFVWRNPRKPGFLAATFMVAYAIVRMIDEQFRRPDDLVGLQLYELSRGQWLSIGLFFIGLFSMFWWSRATTKMVNGWGRVHSIRINRK